VSEGLKKLKRIAIFIAELISFVAVISMLSLSSIEFFSSNNIHNIDKVYHFIVFFCFAFPLSLLQPRRIIWVFLGVMIFGGSIELIQNFIDRQASLADFLANGAGATAGVIMARKSGNWL
jgi:VanZ family protein